MALAALIRDRVLHYIPRQVEFYSLSIHVIDIKRPFQRNKLLYYLERCSFTEYVGLSTQHKYLKHGGREPVTNKKLHWGKLSEISQNKLSAPKCFEISDENCE